MKNSNPFNIYKDVIGAKVFYKGCPVYFEDYISNYENKNRGERRKFFSIYPRFHR